MDHCSGPDGELLTLLMHPSNAGVNNADGYINLIRTACRALPGPERGGNIGDRFLMCPRADGVVTGITSLLSIVHPGEYGINLGTFSLDNWGGPCRVLA
jgi:hypothetical protein